MSSYSTTVYIPDAERDALLAEIRDTNNYIATRREQIEKIKKQAREKEEEIARFKEENERKISAAVNSLADRHRKKLIALSNLAENEIINQTNNVIGSIDKLRREALTNKLRANQLNEEVAGIAQTISNVFNDYIAREADAGKRAGLLSEELNSMLAQIEQLSPEVFKPAEYNGLLSLVNHVAENISRGDYNAALTVSQNGILESTQLLTRLMILNEQYNDRLANVQSQMLDLRQRFDSFDSEADGVIPVNVGDETIDYEYDISFWSEGNYETLRERFNYLANILDHADEVKIPEKQLQDVEGEIGVLSQLLDECDLFAREAMIASASNFRSAEVADVFINQLGYRLQASGYKDDDDRKPYTMTYVNGNGTELVAVLASSGNSEKPEFIIEVVSDDEVEADITKRGVLSGLQSAGAELTVPAISNDCENNTTADAFINRVVAERETLRQSRRPQIVKLEQ